MQTILDAVLTTEAEKVVMRVTTHILSSMLCYSQSMGLGHYKMQRLEITPLAPQCHYLNPADEEKILVITSINGSGKGRKQSFLNF